MKIVKAMKKVSRLKGEIKDIKSRMVSCLNTIEGNKYDEVYGDLLKNLFSKIKEVIALKVGIMHTNVKYDMFSKIINLGELKGYIEFLKELEPKSGMQERAFDDETVVYVTQLSIKEKNKQIKECQDLINKVTDELDDFNAQIDVEIYSIKSDFI